MREGQVSLEFLIMAGFAGVSLLLAMTAAYSLFQGKVEGSALEKLQSYARYLQREIILASEVQPGYQRSITIPGEVDGISFQVYNDQDYLYLNSSYGEFLLKTPKTSGSLHQGRVTIRNNGGVVEIS